MMLFSVCGASYKVKPINFVRHIYRFVYGCYALFKVTLLQKFIKYIQDNPNVYSDPKLDFFVDYLKKLGATIPEVKQPYQEAKSEATYTNVKNTDDDDDISSDEQDTLDDDEQNNALDSQDEDYEGKMKPDIVPEYTSVVKIEKELSDADYALVQSYKQKANEALKKQDYAEALECINKVIELDRSTAMNYAKKADILLQMKLPNACIQECMRALEINPDNAKAYHLRGLAYYGLGMWEKANADLENGQRIDFDEKIYEIQKLIWPKSKDIIEKQRVKNRRREERRQRNLNRQRRRKIQQNKKIYEEQKKNEENNSKFTGMGEDYPFTSGMGGMPTGDGSDGFSNLLGGLMGNPELKKAMDNPKVLQALMEIMQNPSSSYKYKNDPEVMNALSSIMGSVKNKAGPNMNV